MCGGGDCQTARNNQAFFQAFLEDMWPAVQPEWPEGEGVCVCVCGEGWGLRAVTLFGSLQGYVAEEVGHWLAVVCATTGWQQPVGRNDTAEGTTAHLVQLMRKKKEKVNQLCSSSSFTFCLWSPQHNSTRGPSPVTDPTIALSTNYYYNQSPSSFRELG